VRSSDSLFLSARAESSRGPLSRSRYWQSAYVQRCRQLQRLGRLEDMVRPEKGRCTDDGKGHDGVSSELVLLDLEGEVWRWYIGRVDAFSAS
jgi:hypothetical protein